MANIKFSQFTVGNTESDIDFVVGYKGANNIQISPTNLLAASLSGYLPLTGGTMTGTSGIDMPDNFALKAGNSQDLQIYHDSSNSIIDNSSGHLFIRNSKVDRDIIFQADDGTGVATTTYFKVDGGAEIVVASKEFRFLDNVPVKLGTGPDFQMLHNGTTTSIENSTGNLLITNFADDSDIIFKSDDGSGGTTEYFKLDGSNVNVSISKQFNWLDSVVASFGNSADLKIFHNGTDSVIQNDIGNLEIQNRQDDGDIVFKSDDGSGGVTTYFFLDGSAGGALPFTVFPDNSNLTFGTGYDLRQYHNGIDSYLDNYEGDLIIRNYADDKDIIFKSDDGFGGTTTYFQLDGSHNKMIAYKDIHFEDNIKARFGNYATADLEIYHDGSNSYINNLVGELNVWQNANDKDIVFASDNGSGGIVEYLRLDGSDERLTVNAPNGMLFFDNIRASFGASSDLQIYHDGTHSYLSNNTGNLYIQQLSDDSDIVFQSDDGAGGVTEYFKLDGSSKRLDIPDSIPLCFGAADDLQITHNGTTSYIQNYTGNLIIENNTDDSDIIFKSDDGAGGVTTYLFLDGSNKRMQFNTDFITGDNNKIVFGNGGDLEIYHDGSNSYINDAGTGTLYVKTNSFRVRNSGGSEDIIKALEDGAVTLYYDNAEKLVTSSTGIKILSVSEYADNTAAIAGGLTTGDVYRTGDLLKIVH